MATAIRLKFSRKGPVSYLGHLDILRYFQKAILRAGIDIRYSEGFNPHQILSFAYPLGVSMETEGDYCDIEVNSFESVDAIVNSLNDVMNEGISIVSGSIVPENSLNAMASVAMAEYNVVLNDILLINNEIINDYLNQASIMIEKEGNKGNIKEVDIKEGIKELNIIDGMLHMKLLSGSALNIKPSQIIDTINKYYSINLQIQKIIRLEIYQEINKSEDDNKDTKIENENIIYKPLGDFDD